MSQSLLLSLLPADTRWMQESTTRDERIDLAASIVSNVFLFLLIFGLSATVDVRHLRQELRNKFALLTGVVMQFLIMPLLGFLAVLALRNHGLTQAMGITLLVVTASPGGSYSNWWCSTFNADLALSVAMTAVSTILSIGLLPANLILYSILVYGVSQEQGVLQSLDLKAIFVSLAIVIAAILIGLYASYKIDSVKFHQMANRLGSVSGILLIVTSIFLSSSAEAGANFWSQPWTFYVGVSLPCLVGLILANVACKCFSLRKPEQVAISIECAYQNVGVATSVAVNMFDDPIQRAQALSVPIFYGFVEAFVICIYCVWAWKVGWTKAPRKEKLCVVLTKTYEIGHDDDDESDETQQEDDFDNDDDDDESPPDTIHLTGWKAWLAWPFVPRFPDTIPTTQEEEDVEIGVQATPKKGDEPKEERCRFVSEDYTAATSTTGDFSSPPNTPGGDSTFDSEDGEVQVRPLPSDQPMFDGAIPE